MPMRALEDFERQLQRQLRFIELKRGAIGRRIGWRLRDFEQKNLNRAEFRFIRSMIEKPLTVGATASGWAAFQAMVWRLWHGIQRGWRRSEVGPAAR